jgi:phosphoribosylaminoimidazolecarboxamide formyltransferase/IMP cyclohydrolase
VSDEYRPIRRALISVYDKTGLDELVRALADADVEIVSTGSTAGRIEAAGVPVIRVEELTGFPECLDGRVKTLHPRVHAGLLADLRLDSHVAQLAELGVEPFDLLVSNLYPFSETVASGADVDACVEQIDIGGPAMVRAAAKNHPSVAVVPADDADGWPAFTGLALRRSAVLRYGENPHQQAALYVDPAAPAGLARAEQVHGKEMSYNNYVDADAAWRAAHDFADPCVAIIKHANPCGIAVGADVAEAHRKAHACDPVSAFGGVIATNVPVSVAMAEQVAEIFTEVIVAPAFDDGAVDVLAAKKNLRILVGPEYAPAPAEFRQVSGGLLVQMADRVDAPGDDPANWRLAAGEAADEATLADLAFAWRRHGSGQPGRLGPAGGGPGR